MPTGIQCTLYSVRKRREIYNKLLYLSIYLSYTSTYLPIYLSISIYLYLLLDSQYAVMMNRLTRIRLAFHGKLSPATDAELRQKSHIPLIMYKYFCQNLTVFENLQNF